MGFLEKNKPEKAPKTPISIDQSWINILQRYLSNHSFEELHEGIQRIRELLYDKEATWERQSQYIRSLGKSLPSKKSKSGQQSTNESLPSHVVNQVELILEPIISGIYFSSITTLTKRHCIPILDSCYMISDRNSFCNSSIQDQSNNEDNKMIKEFEQEYSRYITLNNYTTHSFSQKGMSIYITLDFPLGFSTVEKWLFETLQFFSECLSLIIQNVNEEKMKSATASDSLSLSKRVNDAQHVTKTLLALLSRFDQKLRPQFESIGNISANDYNNKEEVTKKLVRDLLNGCLMICSDNIYIKDVRQLAGMTMAATLNLLGSSRFVSDKVMAMFFASLNNEKLQNDLNFMNHLGVQIPDILFKETGWNGDDPPMLAICRGLLSNLNRKALISLLSGKFQFKISVLRSDDANPKTLHHILFLSIAHFCDNAFNSQTKVLAFETMGLWLQESENILRDDDVSKFIIHDNSSIFNSQVLEKLMLYVWNNWEDPVDAIQFKVKTIFEKLLDIIGLKSKLEQSEEIYNNYLINLLKQLLSMDLYRKVKYALLLLLLPRVGTDRFLSIQPEFVSRTLEVLHNLVIAPRASALLVSFFELRLEELLISKLRDTTIKKDEKREEIINKWIDLWLAPICQGLSSSDDILRKNVSALILQPLFKASSSSFWRIIDILQNNKCGNEFIKNEQYRLNALIVVLKVGRSLDLVDGNMFVENSIDTNCKKIQTQPLHDAIYHSDLNLRIDVLGLICESRKLTNEVTSIELALLKSFFQLNLNSTSPEFRQKLFGHLNKFFTRLRGNLYNQWKNYQSQIKYVESHKSPKVQDILSEANQIKQKIDSSQSFLNWLIELLAASIYPGSSFQRVSSALRTFTILIKIFGIEKTPSPEGFVAQHCKTPTFPFQLPLASARNTKLILNCLMNPFDENRMLAYEILQGFPSPLPGIESKDNVQKILFWALQSMTSTRAGESDSGAMIFRLIFSKYVLELNLDLEVEVKQNESLEDYEKVDIPSINFTKKLFSLLKKQINIASENLLFASQKFPMHGTLLALQYIFKELDYNSLEVKNNFEEWRNTHNHAINLINEVCQIVLDVLSNPSPEGNVPASFQEMEEMIDELILNSSDDFDSEEGGPKHQIILSCCWRAVKEAGSLLAIILLRAPMAVSFKNNCSILDYDKIRKGGDLFQTLLTSIRHRGAFSAVYPGYVAVCVRLLNSPQVKFVELPKIWLEDNINSIMANSISITRRSAGLPLCILAIVSSEPNNRKVLLPWTMKTLIEIGLQTPSDDFDQNIDLPQVHAFNILRTIFMDAKLGTDVLPYVSDGFVLAIKGFSSPSWAVRNCSVMLFSTLLQRTFGTKKTKDEHHSINKLTRREFFSRFPQLYPFLLDELKIAVDQLVKSTKVLQSKVHPGLYPILTLLSRLHPSLIEDSSSVLTMSPFVSLVLSCAASPIYKTREMAARAIIPLIPSNDLISTCTKLINEIVTSNQNELHGKLTQVQYLMRGHLCGNVANFDVMKDFIIKMVPIFKSKIYLAFRENSCNITRYLFLDILYEFAIDNNWIFIEQNKNKRLELLRLMEDKFFEIRQSLFDMSFYDFFDMNSVDHVSKVGYYLVRQQMARIIIKSLINQENSEHSSIIMDTLSDLDYEVRLVSLEMLIDFLNSSSNNKEICIDRLMLQCKIIKMIFQEEFYQNCFQKEVELLTLINSEKPFPELTSKKSLGFGIEEFWKKLFNHIEHLKSSTKIEAALPLLGSLLSQIWQDTSLSGDFKSESLNQWCKYIDKNTKPEVTLKLREATTSSLQLFSQHLFKGSNFSKSEDTQQIIILYLVLIRLTQDDDIDLRHTAALIISKASGLKVPVDCDRAHEICFEYMTKLYSRSLHLYIAFLQIITGNEKPDDILKTEMNPTKVLFAIENPNIYKEDMIDIQLAYKHLKFAFNKEENVLNFPDAFKCDIPRFVVTQLWQICELLRSEEVKNKNNGMLGFTSRPIIFVVIYRVIISVLVMMEIVSNKQEIIKEIKSIIQELTKDKIQLHPLLNDILFEGFTHYFNSEIIINDDEKFSKEYERFFLLSN